MAQEERRPRNPHQQSPKMLRNVFFQRAKSCPLSGEKAPEIDYKNVKLLKRYVTETGKLIPARISSVSAKKQRKLSKEVKRARNLALLPFTMHE